MSKNKKKEENGNSNKWMVTFSDILNLLLTFFVLLLSMSSLDNKKLKETIGHFNAYLGVLGFGSKSAIEILPDMQPIISESNITKRTNNSPSSKKKKLLSKRIKNVLKINGIDKEITISIEKKGTVLSLPEKLLFELGGADIHKKSAVFLDKLADVLEAIPLYNIRIEGHTDNIPISTFKYPSNWELSIARGVNVLKYLIKKGIDPKRLSVVGYGDSKPLVSNNSARNRLKNRRVEIVIIEEGQNS
ncbi:MAG: flagellar motor protein MotB [Nitrospirota bacterium]